MSKIEIQEAVRAGLLADSDVAEGCDDGIGLFTESDAIANMDAAMALGFDLFLPKVLNGRLTCYLIMDEEGWDLFADDREVFYARIVHEVRQLVRQCRGTGVNPAVDLNIEFVANWKGIMPWLFELYGEVEWIDIDRWEKIEEERNAR